MNKVEVVTIKRLITNGQAKLIKECLELSEKKQTFSEDMGRVIEFGQHPALDLFLDFLTPLIEQHTKEKLVPSYQFSRKYLKDSFCRAHTDRESCVWTCSLCIDCGYEKGKLGYRLNGKDIEVEQSIGDLIIIRGCDIKHWRPKVSSEITQMFLHYVPNTDEYKALFFDGKKQLALMLEDSGLLQTENAESRYSVAFDRLKKRFFAALKESLQAAKST
ncbi:hypothetical protein ACUR5C_14545 [Aliikangiella sp. IMCC44653]